MSGSSRLALAVFATLSMMTAPVPAGAQPYVGEVMSVGTNFCPAGWEELDGQLLAIAEYETLFILIGTTYGGDGESSFALPDMRGRVPMHQGFRIGQTTRQLGEMFGTETTTLTVQNMPAHSHNPQMRVSRVNATVRNPIGAYVARATTNVFTTTPPTGSLMAADAIQSDTVGASLAYDNIQPVLVVRYCISLFGIFPSQT